MSFRKNIKRIIEQTKHAHSDIFGFGEYVRAKKPSYWRKYVNSMKHNITSKETANKIGGSFAKTPKEVEGHMILRLPCPSGRRGRTARESVWAYFHVI
ncbi:hypothetical protein H7C18_10655 [Cohnella sp. CBP 2801]|uniref:Spore germination GerAC-like C-terminal domain-containing protein n=1 Tax=Cohnella zeiphila TaxID=2761120 RepID=A0A7X0VVF7_9BACL|nr:hypothetical protein [Cohnella zeiphila]